MRSVQTSLPMRHLTRILKGMTFQRQLAVAMAMGVLSMALFSSIGSAWQGSRQVRDNLVQQSLRIASSLATQSQLALLSASPENANEAVAATLAFPDVLRVEVRKPDGGVLLAIAVPALGTFIRASRVSGASREFVVDFAQIEPLDPSTLPDGLLWDQDTSLLKLEKALAGHPAAFAALALPAPALQGAS